MMSFGAPLYRGRLDHLGAVLARQRSHGGSVLDGGGGRQQSGEGANAKKKAEEKEPSQFSA